MRAVMVTWPRCGYCSNPWGVNYRCPRVHAEVVVYVWGEA